MARGKRLNGRDLVWFRTAKTGARQLSQARNDEGVSDDFLATGDYELVVAMQRTPASIHLEPLYDAAGVKVKA